MNEMITSILKEEIKVGTEVVHDGRWGIVEEIEDGVIFCRDEDGGEFELSEGQLDNIL